MTPSGFVVPVPSTEPDFSEATLLERVMGDRELARIVVETFLEDIRQRLAILEDQAQRGEDQTLTFQVHTIKGAAANVGAHALASFAAQFESALLADSAMDCREWVAQLGRQYALAQSQIVASTLLQE